MVCAPWVNPPEDWLPCTLPLAMGRAFNASYAVAKPCLLSSSAEMVMVGDAVSICACGINDPVTTTVSSVCFFFWLVSGWSVVLCADTVLAARLVHKPMMMEDTSNRCFMYVSREL